MKKLEKKASEIFGFRDITFPFFERNLDYVYVNNFIRGVPLKKEIIENHEGEKVKIYEFSLREYNLIGRVFPFDEVVNITKPYDLIIKKLKNNNNPVNVDTQIYHDLEIGEEILIKVSGFGKKGDPLFMIFGHILGFIVDSSLEVYNKIRLETKVHVKINDVFRRRDGKYNIFVKPLKIY